jgi:TonB family protein
MSLLLKDARFGTRTVPRSRLSNGLWLSVVAHGTIVGVLAAIVPTRASEKPSTPPMRSIGVFTLAAIEPMALTPIPVSAPRLPSPPRPAPPVRTAAIPEVHKAAVSEPIVTKTVEAAPATLLPAAVPVFQRPVETALPVRPPETGLFERSNGPRASQAAAAVTTGGFGSSAPSQRAAANGNNDVRTAGFDRASAPVASPAAPAPKPIDRPVEILFKPLPEYTDEARSARIEGTVALDLEFTAAGEVRVLRVVNGLGHGLDEAAERAASRIRFKPAQSDGRSVVSRATVYITFRLS